MFCMAVWIKDWLSLLLSCSNLCPLSLQTGSGEFPEQSGLTFPGRYRLRHFTKLKCKAKKHIKVNETTNTWKHQASRKEETHSDMPVHTHSRETDAVYNIKYLPMSVYYIVKHYSVQATIYFTTHCMYCSSPQMCIF